MVVYGLKIRSDMNGSYILSHFFKNADDAKYICNKENDGKEKGCCSVFKTSTEYFNTKVFLYKVYDNLNEFYKENKLEQEYE